MPSWRDALARRGLAASNGADDLDVCAIDEVKAGVLAPGHDTVVDCDRYSFPI